MIVEELTELGELYWQSNQHPLSVRLKNRFEKEKRDTFKGIRKI